jgi:hypothetical protein
MIRNHIGFVRFKDEIPAKEFAETLRRSLVSETPLLRKRERKNLRTKNETMSRQCVHKSIGTGQVGTPLNLRLRGTVAWKRYFEAEHTNAICFCRSYRSRSRALSTHSLKEDCTPSFPLVCNSRRRREGILDCPSE